MQNKEMGTNIGQPELIIKGGKPAAVLLNLDDYRKMLERLGDTESLRMLDNACQKL